MLLGTTEQVILDLFERRESKKLISAYTPKNQMFAAFDFSGTPGAAGILVRLALP